MLTLAQVALVALLVTADSGYDTVFLQNGGRLRGTVVEETPASGVTIQIPGGQLRTVPPAEIFRIEYRDGSLGLLGPQASRPGQQPQRLRAVPLLPQEAGQVERRIGRLGRQGQRRLEGPPGRRLVAQGLQRQPHVDVGPPVARVDLEHHPQPLHRLGEAAARQVGHRQVVVDHHLACLLYTSPSPRD